MEETARPARPGDLPVLVHLAEACVAELAPARGGAIWAGREARPVPAGPSLERDLTRDDARVVVGEVDGIVVGYAVVQAEPLRGGETLGLVSDLYVAPDFRCLGVGEVMLGEVLRWAEAHGCCGVDAVALPGMRETKNFFESFGLVARAILVHRSFGAAVAEEDGAGA